MARSTPELIRVAVVGGGLAGLSATYELIRRTRLDSLPLEIRLYEAEERLGGVVRSERVDGFLLEHGPASFSTVDEAALRLVAELGLQGELIPGRAERGAQVWWQDARHPMPPGIAPFGDDSLRALASNTLLGTAGKLRVALERLMPARQRDSDESVAAFVSRRFGRQMFERVGEPLLAGAVAGDASVLAARHAAPHLLLLERQYGSVGRGLRRVMQSEREEYGIPRKATRSSVVSFRHGLQRLVDALVAAIERSDRNALKTGRRVIRLRPAGDPVGAAAYALRIDGADDWVADVCVLAVPARSAAQLLQPFAPEVAEPLRAIPHASSLTVYLGYERGVAGKLPEETACLVPASERRPTLACSLVHRELDYRVPPGSALLRVHMGGERHPSLVEWADETAVRAARKEVAALYGLRDQPSLTRIVRHRRAHPQYLVDHSARLASIEREIGFHSGLLLAGRSLYGLTLAEVIYNGRATAATAADQARTRLT